jgi:hypothetical protein
MYYFIYYPFPTVLFVIILVLFIKAVLQELIVSMLQYYSLTDMLLHPTVYNIYSQSYVKCAGDNSIAGAKLELRAEIIALVMLSNHYVIVSCLCCC